MLRTLQIAIWAPAAWQVFGIPSLQDAVRPLITFSSCAVATAYSLPNAKVFWAVSVGGYFGTELRRLRLR
jgi:hypothetical protein